MNNFIFTLAVIAAIPLFIFKIPNIVHTGFEYDKYTQQDGSNDRFMEKQKNTNALRDAIFDALDDDKPINPSSKGGQSELPF